MNNRTLKIFTTWPFLVSLVALLVNDWWLKAAFPNVVTGKLSDFSGVALVALLLFASTSHRKLSIYLMISGAFLWWKSPLSDPFIHFVNSQSTVRIGRVVDYGDLLALVVLPACHYIAVHQSRFSVTWPCSRKIIAVPLAVTTLFAIMATSVVPTRHEYVVRPTSPAVEVQRGQVADAIAVVAAKHGLTCEDCSSDPKTARFVGEGMTMSYLFSDSNAVSFTIEAYSTGIFFGASGEEKADALRTALKSILGERFEGLEYVEPLRGEQQWTSPQKPAQD